MKRNLKYITFPLLVFMLLVRPVGCPAQDKYDYIDIDNPFSRKIPVAVPAFADLSEQPADSGDLEKMPALLSETLVFTRYFDVLDPAAYLMDPEKKAITKETVTFSNWTAIGADYLVTGGFEQKKNRIKLELRLFDTVRGKQLVGKRYKGTMTDHRRIIRRFCTEIIKHFTGSRGFFNSKIAFVSNGTGSKEIYICDFDGHEPKQFTHHNTISMFPDWNSDGKWLAYTSYLKGKPDIYIEHVRREDDGSVINRKGMNIDPAWMPGKFVLAATMSFSGTQKIYLLTGSGKMIKKLTSNWGSDISPAWSPDGKQMAFVSNRSGSPQIYVLDLDQRRSRRITFEGKYNTQPCWSPRGDRLAYTSRNGGLNNIAVIGLKDLESVQLTRDAGHNESPSWSPDGSLIAFSSTREGRSRIYVMTAYGTDQQRLLSLPGAQSNPKWSPSTMHN